MIDKHGSLLYYFVFESFHDKKFGNSALHTAVGVQGRPGHLAFPLSVLCRTGLRWLLKVRLRHGRRMCIHRSLYKAMNTSPGSYAIGSKITNVAKQYISTLMLICHSVGNLLGSVALG